MKVEERWKRKRRIAVGGIRLLGSLDLEILWNQFSEQSSYQ